MSKPLMYEPLSLCFNAFKWSCESSRTGPISESAVKAQSHLLPWWTERVHKKWNWKTIRCTHTHTNQSCLSQTLLHTFTHGGSYVTFQSVIIITDMWWAAVWCRKVKKKIQAKKNWFTRVIELQSKNYESERAPDRTQCNSILTFNLIKRIFFFCCRLHIACVL